VLRSLAASDNACLVASVLMIMVESFYNSVGIGESLEYSTQLLADELAKRNRILAAATPH